MMNVCCTNNKSEDRVMRTLIAMVLSVLSVLAMPREAAADSVFFSFGQPGYTALPGSKVDVKVYLNFTGSEADGLRAQGGLHGAAVVLEVVGSPADPARIVETSDIRITTPWSDFEEGDVFDPVPPAVVDVSMRMAASEVSPSYAASGNVSFLLGTFGFTVGAPGTSTTLRAYLDDFWSPGQIVSPTFGYIWDDNVRAIGDAYTTITVIPLPAPVLMGLAGMALAAGSAWRMRRQPRGWRRERRTKLNGN
jgi:hypothetical protein